MTSRSSTVDLREHLLSSFIERGLTVDEMVKEANALASVLEQATQEKQASPGVGGAAAATGAASEILKWLGQRAGNTTDTLVQGGARAIGNIAPLALLGSVAAPIAMGYYSGDLLSKLTDPGSERLDELKKQEEIAELRAQTERLRQRQHLASTTA